MAHHTTDEPHRRGPRSGATAAGLAALLLVPLSACGQQDAAAPAASSTPQSASASASSTPATPASSSPAPESLAAGEVLAVARAYLQARADGDAEAAWAALSPSSQEAWTDRAQHDQAVQEAAPTYAALLGAGPDLAETDLGEGNGAAVAATGVADPDGSPRVVGLAVVVDANGQVQEGPDDAAPTLTWVNPTFEAAGSLGLAALDETAPLAVEVGQGAGVLALSVDGAPLPLEGSLGSGSAALPELTPGQHVVTVVYGYPGEISQALVAVVETGGP